MGSTDNGDMAGQDLIHDYQAYDPKKPLGTLGIFTNAKRFNFLSLCGYRRFGDPRLCPNVQNIQSRVEVASMLEAYPFGGQWLQNDPMLETDIKKASLVDSLRLMYRLVASRPQELGSATFREALGVSNPK
jgi:hypothetical protein